jgi:hypothetical protein
MKKDKQREIEKIIDGIIERCSSINQLEMLLELQFSPIEIRTRVTSTSNVVSIWYNTTKNKFSSTIYTYDIKISDLNMRFRKNKLTNVLQCV